MNEFYIYWFVLQVGFWIETLGYTDQITRTEELILLLTSIILRGIAVILNSQKKEQNNDTQNRT